MAKKINFIKMHGLGNDFVILDFRNKKDHEIININKRQVIKFSDRKLGIGCDQLIILKDSKVADCKMVIFNADGSKSGACGNASRCVAKLIGKAKGRIQVGSRILEFKKVDKVYSLNLGKVESKWNKIPLRKEFNSLDLSFDKPGFKNAIALNIGNPHLVFFVNDVSKVKISEVGRYFEMHDLFPEKINVNFAQILTKNHLKLRVWERGVGETLACGSGAAATVFAAHIKKLIDGQCLVSLPGGNLIIELNLTTNEVYMSGPAEEVFKGYVEIANGR